MKKSLKLIVHLKIDGSKNDSFNDSLITDEYVSWKVCSCKIWISESLYFSEVDGLLISDGQGEKDHHFLVSTFQWEHHYQWYRYHSKLQIVVTML